MRPMIAVIGGADDSDTTAIDTATQVGRLLVDAGFRIVCGGMTGVMAAVCRGARLSPGYRDGDCIGIIMDYDKSKADPGMDIVIPTGMGYARNTIIVASGDAVIAIGGGAGTLSEIALAWNLGKFVVAVDSAGGWAKRLSNQRLDRRRPDRVVAAKSPARAVEIVSAWLESRS